MKALPLWQPWASLVACGAKRVETRSWPTPTTILGERIAIYATKGGLSKGDLHDLLDTEPFGSALRHLVPDAYAGAPTGKALERALPRGVIVCTVRLARCAPITAEAGERLRVWDADEYAFGDYTAGRWAWVLEDVLCLDPPALAAPRGQGLFEWEDGLTLFDEVAS
jgi:hypothetical protein